MSRIIFMIILSLVLFVVYRFIYKRSIGKIKSNGKKKIIIIATVIIIITISSYILGYRLTPLSASRANPRIEKNYVLIDDLDLDWAYVYFYHDKEKDKYYTTVSEKNFFMYVSRSSIWCYGHSGDSIRTIGSMSYNNGKGKTVRLLMIDSDDKNIDSIIIKDEYNIKETKITIDNPEIILIDDSINQYHFEVIAVDQNEKELYYYGYPKGTNVLKTEDYKWYPIEKNEDE